MKSGRSLTSSESSRMMEFSLLDCVIVFFCSFACFSLPQPHQKVRRLSRRTLSKGPRKMFKRCGLFLARDGEKSGFDQVPLGSTSMEASIFLPIAQVKIHQVYMTKEKGPIQEAVYFFPVLRTHGQGTVVLKAEMEDGTIIRDEVDTAAEKDVNKEEKKKSTLFEAFFGEEEAIKPDIFKFKVGLLPPGAIVKISIEYGKVLKKSSDSQGFKLSIPKTLAPRYSSAPPLQITTNICLKGELKRVECLSKHKIAVESRGPIKDFVPSWTKSIVTLKGVLSDMDGHDFVLLITPEGPTGPGFASETLDTMMRMLSSSFST